jgi:hypothetical protein
MSARHGGTGDWTALGPIGPGSARGRFAGRFYGRPVRWDAEILTLNERRRRLQAAGEVSGGELTLRQFIEIGEETAEGRRLTVGLNLPAIDEPAVRKTMVMIRNYKRLRCGRHDYGEPVVFSAAQCGK